MRIDANNTMPKHMVLREWIRSNILDGSFSYGSKLPSENELSIKFGVSRQTVRQAIGALESEGLLERKRGSGTYISSKPKKRQSRTMNIGVTTTYLDDYIFPSIIKGIDSVLSQNGYTMSLSITYNKVELENNILRSVIEKGVDGLIIEPTKSAFPNPNSSLYAKIMEQNIPCLFINGYYSGMDFGFVALDDFAAGRETTKYLIEYGHRNIGGIFKSDDIQGHLRYAGFGQALGDNKMSINDHNVMWYVTEDVEEMFNGDYDRSIMKRLGGCTGIVCYNDQIAVKLMSVFERNGKRVPDDISIVSFDNSNLATIAPVGLTSVNHPKAMLGEEAANRIIKLIEYPDYHATLMVRPQIVVRDSVINLPKE